MPTLYILCGPSGCGKSTWAHNFIKNNDIRYVSRDEIRYSLIKEDEDYFSHEKEVFKKFSSTIAQTLVDGFDVIADATHLNYASRHKLISAVNVYITNYSIVYVVFDIPMEIAIERNDKRTGRAKVPEEAIKNMYFSFTFPYYEDERTVDIWIFKEGDM